MVSYRAEFGPTETKFRSSWRAIINFFINISINIIIIIIIITVIIIGIVIMIIVITTASAKRTLPNGVVGLPVDLWVSNLRHL